MIQTINRQGEGSEGFKLGDRLLYLRTPQFTGADVEELQTALGALGFACGGVTGTFGAYTEGALRKFQLNMGLESDGIAGINTYAVLGHLQNAWKDKPQIERSSYMGFARAADVLERHAVCLFGTQDFARRVATYMSNLALATNPSSKMVSAETLLVPPDANMVLARVVVAGQDGETDIPRVVCDDMATLGQRIASAISAAQGTKQDENAPARIELEVRAPLEGTSEDVMVQSAHHDAIMLLDAFCAALS